MKKALVVASTAGFIRGFLIHDMQLLQQKGYEVHCAANAKSMILFDANELFPSLGIIFHQVDFSSSSPFSKDSIIAAKQFKNLIDEYQYEFIHCHTPIVGAIVRMMSIPMRRRGCKIIYTTHGLAFPKGSDFKSKVIYGGTEWLCSWLTDAVITINQDDYKTMKKMGCRKVFYINGVGVDTAKYHNVQVDRKQYREKLGVADDDIMVLTVGELSARKNQQVIIKALAQLKDPRYVFVICGKEMSGTGTYDFMVRLAKELNVRVKFLGFRTDIPEILQCADLAVLPSKREGLGLAGIEALASGIPVVGASVQGIKDYVIDGKTGYLCSPTDEKQFADKIKLLSDPELRNVMRRECVNKAEEFRTDVSWKQMEEIYKEILG